MMAIYDPKNKNNRTSVPNKLFEAMSVGRPIVVANRTFTSKVVNTEGCGFPIDYGDVDALRDIIREMNRDPTKGAVLGERGHKAHVREYNLESMSKRLVRGYSYVLK